MVAYFWLIGCLLLEHDSWTMTVLLIGPAGNQNRYQLPVLGAREQIGALINEHAWYAWEVINESFLMKFLDFLRMRKNIKILLFVSDIFGKKQCEDEFSLENEPFLIKFSYF